MTHYDRLFRSAEIEAEALIGIARMLVAAILGLAAAFLIQRDGLPDDPRVLREVYLSISVLVAYFGLGLLSLAIVKLGLYRTWLAWLLAGAEVVLIALNIYFDLVMTGASSLAALASPAGYLLAVFLVLQTLRYRLVFQISMSAILIAAVVALLLFDPGSRTVPDPKTMRYLAANYAGIPNFIRVIMLLLVVGIAALSVWRGRRLLADIAEEAEIRANQKRFLPDELSNHMTDTDIEQMRAGRLAELVIMFVDIRGFTALSETMTPRELSAFLSEYRARVNKVAAAHGGVVDKFIGDGALIVFGLNTDLASASIEAIRSGREALAELEAWNSLREARQLEPVRVVVAIHAGGVMVGAIGDDNRLEFSVIGPPVNEASRIESIAKEHDAAIVVSKTALDSAINQIDAAEWRSLGEITLRGSSSPTSLFALR
ncbi:adenylate/guanylate cyclase domain-containing protein [Parasphingopyxis algicola]|uniref:adenylate/guanylate cyclase domain-containing protein n=1 Tax=Parasphingopyxis algicola TaxID=2026624 RepID=UPI0015A103F3|nr:adenylate/guanylate cyclase domain-containing protein [Parasphingopyxis algicola]QLC26437.1 adenylate/guanylate cyclase domain-containing protein [Parasphingopyxis algicola]